MSARSDTTLAGQLDQLRAILTCLAFVGDSHRHQELIEQATLTIAAVRKTRATLAMTAVRARPVSGLAARRVTSC